MNAIDNGRPIMGDEKYDASRDPASGIQGMPPNAGDWLLRHPFTFQGIAGSQAKVYRPSDEAIQDSFDNARFMRNDATVMECVEMRQRAVALLDWSVEPEDENDPQQKEVATLLTKILEKIPRFMQYRENLLHATWYGKYGIQHKWGYRWIAGKMRATPLRWLPVNGDKIVFRYDDGMKDHRPDQIGIRVGAGIYSGPNALSDLQDQYRQRGFRGTVERVSKIESTDHGLAYFLDTWEQILLAVHKYRIEDGDYHDPSNAGRIHGLGLRSVIYWTWYQKQETLANLMDFMERSATGIDIWYYPMGNSEAEAKTRAAAQEKIENGRNIVLVPRPVGPDNQLYGVEHIEPGMAGAEQLKTIVTEYYGHSIKRYILGQTLTTEASATGLGSNLADIHMDTFMQIVRYDAMLLEETLTTETLGTIKKLNFPSHANIDYKLRIHTREPDADQMLEAMLKAYDMGLKIDAQQLRDLIGAPKPEGDSEILDKFAQMAEQQAAEQPAPEGAMGPVPGGNMGQLAPSDPEPSAPAEAAEQAEYVANGIPSENSDRKRLVSYAAFREEDHPRDESGKFQVAESQGSIPKLPIPAEADRRNFAREEPRDLPKVWSVSVPQGAISEEATTKASVRIGPRDLELTGASAAFQSLAVALERRLGAPDRSSLSEALYFFTPNGRSIRLAQHDPVYFFEDSGITLVPGHETSSHIPLPHGSYIDPDAIADAAIKANSKLTPLDIEGFHKRLKLREERFALWGRKNEFKKNISEEMSLPYREIQKRHIKLPKKRKSVIRTKKAMAEAIREAMFLARNPIPPALSPDAKYGAEASGQR